jgi:polyferredoxin
LALAGVAISLHLFRKRMFRKIWLLAVIIVIGLWAGNLVSLALIAGWSVGGVAWQLAPGLAAIAMIAIAAPPLTGRNSYCNHLCPHGAVQQLIKPSRQSRRRFHPARNVSRWLRRIPALTLVAAYVALVTIPGIDLSGWEPFNAYLFAIAGWASISVAAVSLLVASVLPMVYCRFGCPTGSLLDYLRRSATSDRLQLGDLVAICLLVLALIYRG